jgi:hypothetical protein
MIKDFSVLGTVPETSSQLELLCEEMARSKMAHEKEMKRIQSEIIAEIKSQLFTCTHCKLTMPLESWSFIQNHWYTEPYGCTGGDYWNNSDMETCHVSCPQCGKQNYIYNHMQKVDLVSYFKEKIWLGKKDVFSKVFDSYPDHNNRETLTQVFPS